MVPGADALVVAAGQQRRPRRRADRRGVEGVVADALVGEPRQRRRVDRTAEGVRQAEADVVEQDDEDVGRVLREGGSSRPAADASTPAASARRRSPTGSAERAGRAVICGGDCASGGCDDQCSHSRQTADDPPSADSQRHRHTFTDGVPFHASFLLSAGPSGLPACCRPSWKGLHGEKDLVLVH